MSNKTTISETQIAQVIIAIVMIACNRFEVSMTVEIAGYIAQILLAVWTFYKRREQKKDVK